MSIVWMARTDPPEDVQQMVAAAIEACHGWRPIVVQGPMRETVESGVCELIDDWPVHANAAGYQLVWFGAFCGVVGFLFFRMLYRIVRTRVGCKARSV